MLFAGAVLLGGAPAAEGEAAATLPPAHRAGATTLVSSTKLEMGSAMLPTNLKQSHGVCQAPHPYAFYLICTLLTSAYSPFTAFQKLATFCAAAQPSDLWAYLPSAGSASLKSSFRISPYLAIVFRS